jgi:hypothetical protein
MPSHYHPEVQECMLHHVLWSFKCFCTD